MGGLGGACAWPAAHAWPAHGCKEERALKQRGAGHGGAWWRVRMACSARVAGTRVQRRASLETEGHGSWGRQAEGSYGQQLSCARGCPEVHWVQVGRACSCRLLTHQTQAEGTQPTPGACLPFIVHVTQPVGEQPKSVPHVRLTQNTSGESGFRCLSCPLCNQICRECRPTLPSANLHPTQALQHTRPHPPAAAAHAP